MSTHLWSGRFETAPDQAAFDFGASFRFDRQLFEDDVVGSLAWAEALERAGVLSAADASAIAAGLTDILEEGRRTPSFVSGADEDVHAFVERQLVARIGTTGKRLHAGRSRNEQVSLDLRLYLKRRIPVMRTAVRRLVAALADRAGLAGASVMPAYTHLRRAQPILVAHFFLAHVAGLRRDDARFGATLDEADVLPLGSGAVAGTTAAVDTELLAQRLGFSRVAVNSIDASSDRDFVASFLHTSALAMVHLSRLAEDLVLFTGEEFGFFELADDVATGSSMMPQKKNPDPLELVRGKTGRVIGRLAGWLATMKGLPTGYNKDLQEDKEATFDTEATLIGSLQTVATVVEGLTLQHERAAEAASGLLLATDVADYLVARGMPFREAHEMVGGMVRRLIVTERDFADLSLSDWQGFSPLFGNDVPSMITAQASVAAKRTPQSTNPEAVARALAETRQWLKESMP